MSYSIGKYPETVYPNEMSSECPEAVAAIDVLFIQMRRYGPNPPGYSIKTLGKRHNGLWQLNLKVEKRQVRLLYAPYGNDIVFFRIHKKSSPQEQERAYALAARRKAEFERIGESMAGLSRETSRTIH